MSLRIQRINELLKQEISELILKELDFSKDIIITVTTVEASPDLRQAKVKVSIMPFLQADKVLKALNFRALVIQRLLNKKLKMKSIPKIKFELDRSEEKARRVDQLLKNV